MLKFKNLIIKAYSSLTKYDSGNLVQGIHFIHFYYGSYLVDNAISINKVKEMHFEHQRSSCCFDKIDIVEA
jgi:hypothetical protein